MDVNWVVVIEVSIWGLLVVRCPPSFQEDRHIWKAMGYFRTFDYLCEV